LELLTPAWRIKGNQLEFRYVRKTILGVLGSSYITKFNNAAAYTSSFHVKGGDSDVMELRGDGFYFNGKKRNVEEYMRLKVK
jgi:hypothetical protein